MDPTDSIGTTFDPLWTLDDNLLSVLRTETPHVRWNLFVSDGSDGLYRNEFRPPFWTLDYNFLSVLRTETPHVRWNLFVIDGSDGLYRNDFRPPLSAWWQFSKCLTNRNSACPMESIRVRFIRWTPSERLSTPSKRLMTIFYVSYEQKPHMSNGIYSCAMDSIGTTFDPLWTLDDNFLSVLRTATPHVRWNLFVPDGSDGLHRNDFRPPLNAWWQFSKCLKKRNSTCPMESIRVRWIRWTPSERLSTPTERLVTIF